VEARENPSGLAATKYRAASGSRIYVSSCDHWTWSRRPVAIGRGPYTSTCCNRAGSIYVHTWHIASFRCAAKFGRYWRH